MFDLKTLAVIKKIPVATGGLDGIMYEDFADRIILTNHSRPIGTPLALDARPATSSARRNSRQHSGRRGERRQGQDLRQ